MPTYEYHCSDCDYHGEYFAMISKMDEDLPKVCEGCGSEGHTKRIFPTSNDGGFVLKGSGWFGSSKSDSKKGY